jgi:hypothetical protein
MKASGTMAQLTLSGPVQREARAPLAPGIKFGGNAARYFPEFGSREPCISSESETLGKL